MKLTFRSPSPSALLGAAVLGIFLLSPLSATRSLAGAPAFEVAARFSGTTYNLLSAPVLGTAPSLLLFGATQKGGTGKGSIYSVTPSGGISNLINFSGANGAFPSAGLALHSDGNLYGSMSGTGGYGSLFKVTQSGSLSMILSFTGTGGANPGNQPSGALTSGSDGNLYGVTQYGGEIGYGSVYQLAESGSTGGLTMTVLKTFTGPDGAVPVYSPILAKDGNLYGVATQGGAGYMGCIYAIDPQRNIAGTLLDFTSEMGAAQLALMPNSGVIQATDGKLYGTACSPDNTLGAVYWVDLVGNFGTLFTFSTNLGLLPVAGVVQGKDGNFYGVCATGGASGYGVVYQVTPSGKMTILHTFSGNDRVDGASPSSPLVVANDGDIYGVTASTVFRLRFGPNPISCKPGPVSYSSATLTAVLNPNNQKTTVYFEYSDDLGFADPTVLKAPVTLTGTSLVSTHADLVNLFSSNTYYFRMKAVNASGTHYTPLTNLTSFKTKAFAEPTTAIAIQADRVTLTTTINPRGQAPKVYFRFGTDPYFNDPPAPALVTGTETVLVPAASLASGFKDIAVKKTLARLLPQTTYYFRVETVDPVFGTQLGDTHQFTTKVMGQFNGMVTNPATTGIYSGWISVKLNSAQSMSGVLYFGGARYALSGAFAANGSFAQTISRGATLPALTVRLSTDPNNHQLTGTVTQNGISTSSISAGQQFYSSAANPAPEKGLYDVLLSPDPNYTGTANPTTNGTLKMRVNPAGRVVVSGKLGDGASLATSGVLVNGDIFPLYSGLYGSNASNYKGSIYGNITFSADTQSCTGDLYWYRAEQPKSLLFPLGFNTVVSANGALIGP